MSNAGEVKRAVGKLAMLLSLHGLVACSNGRSADDDMSTPTDGAVDPVSPDDASVQQGDAGVDVIADGGSSPNGDAGSNVDPTLGGQLGTGDPDSVVLVEIYRSTPRREATDLAFDPATGHLWVTLREPESIYSCTESDGRGCEALQGSTATITNPGGTNPSASWKMDYNAWHFMRRPSSIAFGVTDDRAGATADVSTFFATCHEWRTGNYEDDAADFIGPSLWTSDPAVYSYNGPGGNGSHLDMLHASPFCMGIAHARDNAYWVFNGDAGSLDRYDFHDAHVPGGHDHSDGEIYRYAAGEVERVENVPSHLAYDADRDLLYVADTGNARVAVLDPSTATTGSRFSPNYDGVRVANFMTGAAISDLVPAGTLERPSGLALHDDVLFVTDNATSVIYAFDLEGALLKQLDTDLPAGSLTGIAVGPEDNRVYFVDYQQGAVYRIDVL